MYSARNLLYWGIPPYWFWAGIGFAITMISYMLLLDRNGYCVKYHVPALFFGFIGLALGAKLFGILSAILVNIQMGKHITSQIISTSGIVYYGGLLGFVLLLLITYRVKCKVIDWCLFDIVAICIPLFHSFARIGCFCGGCCYGRISNSALSILYETNQINFAYRLPVQLFEAVACFVIFFTLFSMYRSNTYKGKLLGLYFLFYAIVRFFLEFFRGDAERGVFGPLSFSQIISLIILLLMWLFRFNHRGEYVWKKRYLQ